MEIKQDSAEYVKRFEPRLRPIIKVLLDNEENISDGYIYYASFGLYAIDNDRAQSQMDFTLTEIAEELLDASAVPNLLEILPTLSYPGGKLVKMVAHYEDGSTQTIDGDIVSAAIAKATPLP